ncbi:MAG: hypothetical protein ABII96_08460, partial [Candidatus Zixiibacteriota bacterium]
LDDALGKTYFKALSGQTLSFPNNGQAILTITPGPGETAPYENADVEATASGTIVLNGTLTLSSGYDNFPPKNGFFRIGAGAALPGAVHYRYKTRSGATLSGITGQGLTPTSGVSVAGTITAPQGQYSITSAGYFPSIAGIGLFRRTVEYGWVLSGLLPGGPPPPPPVNLDDLVGKTITGSMDFQLAYPDGDKALLVVKQQGGPTDIDAEAYVFVPTVTPNPFWQNWSAWGGYSSYDLQVKIATGTLSGTTLIDPPTTYANGLTFRAINHGGEKQDFLSVSLVRNGMLVPPDTTVTPPSVYTVWAPSTYYAKDVYVYENNSKIYFQCLEEHTSSKKFSTDIAKWIPLSNANKSMIVLWRRDSNHANGDGSYLAYKILDEHSYIFDASGHIKDWTTLVVRVIEAASVKLQVGDAPNINKGDIITGATGAAMVFRKINDIDGNVVLLLNKISDTFTRPATIAGYNTDGTWGYRSRDNYIWVFYTDPANHSSNTTPMEPSSPSYNVRLGQLRGDIYWPIYEVPSWTAADDKFSLVNWNSNLNTTLFNNEYPTQTIHIMGFGKKEEGAIIRTDLFTRPGPYDVSGDFPGEIGVVSLGGVNDAFFDDLAYRFLGGSDYGLEYVPYVMY